MQVVIKERASALRDRLHDRLDLAARLQCSEHHQPVIAVTIHAGENGWFDARWTTCCEALERAATAIVKARC